MVHNRVHSVLHMHVRIIGTVRHLFNVSRVHSYWCHEGLCFSFSWEQAFSCQGLCRPVQESDCCWVGQSACSPKPDRHLPPLKKTEAQSTVHFPSQLSSFWAFSAYSGRSFLRKNAPTFCNDSDVWENEGQSLPGTLAF